MVGQTASDLIGIYMVEDIIIYKNYGLLMPFIGVAVLLPTPGIWMSRVQTAP